MTDQLSPVLGRYFERRWSHGQGHRLYDEEGRAYLDFACGIAVTALGHAHPRVSAAVHAQVDRVMHVSNGLGYIEAVSRLAQLLADTFPDPLDTVFLANSGAEAIDGALKLARRVTGRPSIIGFSGGFHGRTYGALSITTSNPNYRTGYQPLLPSIHISPYPAAYRDFGGDDERACDVALRHLRRLLAEEVVPSEVAAMLIEPILGEGGYVPAPPAFLRALRALCDEHGILFIADEVQTGYGRTGRMWGFEHAGIVPDVVCVGKAIANGLPLAALVTARPLQERWGRAAHGSTFGGNPVACAAGVAVLETIADERLVDNAAARGEELIAGLRRLAAQDTRVGDVRGVGMMIGVELVKDGDPGQPDGALAERLIQASADGGVLLLTCGVSHNVVRWIPPLDVTREEIDEALGIFADALASSRVA